MKVVNKRMRERTVKKYERRQQEQRERFGHSASERADQFENLTEAEFLAHEAELAKSAISIAMNELKANLWRGADVKLWAHHYPWLTLGVAAASGFTLAGIVKSGRSAAADNQGDEEAHREWLIREAAKAPYNSDPAEEKKPKLGESVLGSLFSLA